MKTPLLLTTLAGICLVASAASAQDPSADPTFGQTRLSAGFPNDPYTVEVIAGGPVDGAALPGACVGNIGEAPDFRLTFNADGSTPLFIRTISASDTTLVINGPDGEWYCDDDSFGDGDAQVRFGRPQSGAYDIWVGAFRGNPETILVITEIE